MNYPLKSCSIVGAGRSRYACWSLRYQFSQYWEEYDFIVSTVVLMFLQADRIPAIIQNMQEKTSVGGYNLIVCAMDTEDYPCSVNFPFTFKEGRIGRLLQGLGIVIQ